MKTKTLADIQTFIKPLFYKSVNILRSKKALRWNKKHFLSFLKDFRLPKIVSDLRVHLKLIWTEI